MIEEDSKGYRMNPEQIAEFNEAKRPRQWAMAILKLNHNEREEAYQAIPERYRDWVKELVGQTLWKQRWRKKLNSTESL